jgi:pyruvate/2-oxoglutarate dehydrogenase complex dihydrolipoamide dehydrogenase (E3) component
VRLTGPNQMETASGETFEADKIVLATGTEAAVPPIPGLSGGPYWTNKEALWTPQTLPESLAVLGTGAIGTEFSQIYARFGTKVTQIEIMPHILPHEDEEAALSMVPALEADGITILAGATTTKANHDGSAWTLDIEGRDSVRTQELLIATGRKPVFDEAGLAAAGVELDRAGKPILSDTLRTTNDHIWAGGDATGELLFTHVGTYEAELIVDDIQGRPRKRDYRVIPRVTFCDPEVASVGLTEEQARDAGHDVATGVARFDDNERAHIDGQTFGLVKVVGDANTGELLGGHIVGEEAGAMIHEIVAAMAGKLTAATVGRAVHAYPTLSESVKSAFLELAQG